MNNQTTDLGVLKEAMIKEWGMESLPKEEQDKMVAELGEVLYKSIVLEASDALSEDDAEVLGHITEENPQNPGAVLDFLREKVPDFDKIAADEVAALKRQFVFQG